MSDPARHAENRNALESFARSLPGFKGYLEREDRRESDRLARDAIASHLDKCKLAVDRWQRSLLDAGQIDAMPLCERLRSRLDRVRSRVRGAAGGYSGFFDFVKVDEQMLDDVYHVDLVLMKDVTEVAKTAEQLGTTGTNYQDSAQRLESQLDAFERSFDKRGELLQGLGP